MIKLKTCNKKHLTLLILCLLAGATFLTLFFIEMYHAGYLYFYLSVMFVGVFLLLLYIIYRVNRIYHSTRWVEKQVDALMMKVLVDTLSRVCEDSHGEEEHTSKIEQESLPQDK